MSQIEVTRPLRPTPPWWSVLCAGFLRSDLHASMVIFALSFVARCGVLVWLRPFSAENFEPVNVAVSLATTGHFANAFGLLATGPTAHVAPLHPFLLSLLYRLAGAGMGFSIAMHLLAITVLSLQYALLPYAARLLSLPRMAGVWSGLIAAAVPVRFWVETSGAQEHVLAGLACIALVPVTAAIFRRGEPNLLQSAGCGLGWGVAFLISPVFMAVLAGLILVLPRRPRLSAVLVCCSALAISPWVIRNYQVLGTLAPVRDNLGLELSVSNNDQATALLERNVRMPGHRHPYSNLAEALKMRAMGETAYYHLRQDEALRWIGDHPRRFLLLTLERIFFFWFNPVADVAKNFFLALLTLGGFWGIYLLYPRNRESARILMVLWLTFQIPYCFVQVSPRYRFPIDWSFWLLSAYALWRFLRARRRTFLQTLPRQERSHPVETL